MKFSWTWIRELSGTALTADDAASLLSAKAFEVESVDGDVMDIKILPNRPDCLSHLGVARELCALEGRRFTAPSYEYATGADPAADIQVQDPQGCLRFCGLVVRGVSVGPSPAWVRERLEACGLRSISNVVDVTNLVMLELGQPMHAFDLRKSGTIVVRRAHDGEVVRALDEARTEYALDDSMLVVADASRPLAIAGIKGGADSGITDDTTDVLLEAACWEPQAVRATSRRLGLRTDASIRFSYGTDPNLPPAALVRAAELLRKVAGASADTRTIVDVYPHPRNPWTVALDGDYARSLLGVALDDGRMRAILDALGFQTELHDGRIIAHVPTRRLDVQGPEDLAEEIGRVYGYDDIPSLAPTQPLYDERAWVAESDADVAWDEHAFIRERQAVTHLLAGAGYSETYNYAFLSDELKTLLKAGDLSELALPQSAEYRWLRTSLVPRLLMQARDNLRFFDDVHLFETGHAFARIGQGKEDVRLALVDAHRAAGKEPFFVLKGAVSLLLERLGIADAYYDDAEPMTWDASAVHTTGAGSRALIRLEGSGQVLGFIGTVSRRVADALKLKGAAAVAELDVRLLVRHAQQEREFAPLPKFPTVVRDIAVLVDQGVKADDILQAVHAAGGDIVEDVDIFDIFLPTGTEKLKAEGDVPEYGKSVAFHVVFRASDRTLRDDEVAKAEAAIKAALQEKFDAQVR